MSKRNNPAGFQLKTHNALPEPTGSAFFICTHMKLVISILTIALLSACGAKLAVLTQSDVERGAQQFPGITLAELQEGQQLFKIRCSQCHPLKNPTSRSPEQWRKVVPRMAAKAENNSKKQKIDAVTQEKILKYLITVTSGKGSR